MIEAYVYDGDGKMVEKTENDVTTIYIGNLVELQLPSTVPNVTPTLPTRTATAPTRTSMATNTRTSSPMPSNTATALPTLTASTTVTRTPTDPFTATPTITKTPTKTQTSSNTPGPSPTKTPTLTKSLTPTKTNTPTVRTATVLTPTKTFTSTPTKSKTPTRTNAPPTFTPTITPTFTKTPSITPTPVNLSQLSPIWRFYYYAGPTRMALRIKDGTQDLVFFLFTDHLGSTNVTSDPNGLMVSLNLYKPWGESRGGAGTTLTDYGFDGQRSMEGSIGLQYFNARWYDSSLSRWTQPDTIVPLASQGVLAWDRYEFVNNNSVNNTDSTGHQIDCHEVGCVTPGTTTTNAGQTYYNNQESENNDKSEKNPQKPPTSNNPPFPNFNPQPDPYHCRTTWNPCFAPPDNYWWWNTNPKDPDYYTLTFNYGDIGGYTATLTLDRYGQSYISLIGGNLGKSFTPYSGTLNAGWIGSASDNVMPDQANMDNFFTGVSFNVSIGAVGDIGGTWSPFAGDYIPHTSIEYGGDFIATLGVSANIGLKLFDFARIFGGN